MSNKNQSQNQNQYQSKYLTHFDNLLYLRRLNSKPPFRTADTRPSPERDLRREPFKHLQIKRRTAANAILPAPNSKNVYTTPLRTSPTEQQQRIIMIPVLLFINYQSTR